MTKVALVTGGIGGIGTAICQTLFKQGVKVIAGHNDDEQAKAWQQAEHAKGFDFEIIYGDVADFESSQKMIKTIENNWGQVSILVNNAGIMRDRTFKKMTLEEWQQVLKTDLDSLFHVTKPVIEGMLAKQFGRIVNISSVSGQMGQFGQTNYSAAKSGVYGFTKALALEVASKGITVNAVSPGFVDTTILNSMPKSVLENVITKIPVGRLAKPAEIARIVGFLCEPDAGYITGANIPVNGGYYMD